MKIKQSHTERRSNVTQSIGVAIFEEMFRQQYPHITHNLTYEELEKWYNAPHWEANNHTLQNKLWFFHDYLLANQLAEVQE